MSDDTAKVRVGTMNSGGRMVMFRCPGCGENHGVSVDGPNEKGSKWAWNESVERPTLSPSILMRTTKMTPAGEAQYRDWMAGKIPAPAMFDSVAVVCHSFVRDGRIEFLSDCTHSLAGKTVDLEPVT